MAFLEVDRLSVSFGGLAALSDVSLTVEQGEIVGLIGPNGAGKTTLFNAVTGFVSPSRGQILFKGRSITMCRCWSCATSRARCGQSWAAMPATPRC